MIHFVLENLSIWVGWWPCFFFPKGRTKSENLANLSFTAGIFKVCFIIFVGLHRLNSFVFSFFFVDNSQFLKHTSHATFPPSPEERRGFPPKGFAPPWKVQEFLRNSRFLRLGETNASIKAIAGVDWRKALLIFSRMTLERLNADWKLANFAGIFLFLLCMFEVCF